MCVKKLTKRQKFKKPNDFSQANETDGVRGPVLSYATLNFYIKFA